MQIIIKKLRLRGATKIGIYFDYQRSIAETLESIGAKYFQPFDCWYCEYSPIAYSELKKHFPTLIIENPNATHLVTGNSRDLSPIATGDIQSGFSKESNPEHKTEIPLPNLRLQRLENIGKYWVFKMHYHETVCRKLKSVKGLHWNQNYKVYMALRNEKVKLQLEMILQFPDFFGSDYLHKDEKCKGQQIRILPHLEDKAWMQVHVPRVVTVHEKIKRFTMARFSKAEDCYLLPAAPVVYENILLQMEPHEVLVINQLPKDYLQRKNMPNRKKIDLTKTSQGLFDQVPQEAKPYVSLMVDMLLARNYSNATLGNYTRSFIQFLRHFEFRDPETISNREVIHYLASLMAQGLSAASGHNIVNGLQFYFHQVLCKTDFEIRLPRPKREKKLPSVLTMEECLGIFKVVDNPKHKLLLLIGYGAGLRVSEIVNLQWCDILFSEYKIHVKNAKGKKDRMVMLPFSIVRSLEIYRQLYNGKKYVFEGQFAAEPYSTGSVQQVMRDAIKKSGLEKKATVHTLRHSFATHLLENGTDIRYIQQFLGNSSIKTTTIYTHLTKSAVDKIQSPLDRMVENNSNKKIED